MRPVRTRSRSTDVELSVAALQATGNGGVKFWVLNASAGATYEQAAKIPTHVYPGVADAPYGTGK